MATLEEQLILHEGLRRKPYVDLHGKTTIGVGRNLTDVGLSLEECGILLADDITAAIKLCQRWVWFEDLDFVRSKVLIDMAFNLGMRLGEFRMMLAACGHGDWNAAADAMLDSDWARQVGARAQRLAAMMRTGQDYDKEKS